MVHLDLKRGVVTLQMLKNRCTKAKFFLDPFTMDTIFVKYVSNKNLIHEYSWRLLYNTKEYKAISINSNECLICASKLIRMQSFTITFSLHSRHTKEWLVFLYAYFVINCNMFLAFVQGHCHLVVLVALQMYNVKGESFLNMVL